MLDFRVTTFRPLFRVSHCTSSYHVQIDIHETLPEMFTRFHRRRMIPVFPVGSLPVFSLVVLLPATSSHQLHRIRNHIAPFKVIDQQMNMIGGDHVIQHTQAETFPGFEEPANPSLTIPGEFQQKLSLVTTMSEVPNLPRNIMTMRALGMTDSFHGHFPAEKVNSKGRMLIFLPIISKHINYLSWSDPAPLDPCQLFDRVAEAVLTTICR